MLTGNGRWQQRARKARCLSAEPQWLRAVYKYSPAVLLLRWNKKKKQLVTLAYVLIDTETAAAFDATESCEQIFFFFFSFLLLKGDDATFSTGHNKM